MSGATLGLSPGTARHEIIDRCLLRTGHLQVDVERFPVNFDLYLPLRLRIEAKAEQRIELCSVVRDPCTFTAALEHRHQHLVLQESFEDEQRSRGSLIARG